MANTKGNGPEGMDPKMAKKLLDKLAKDEAFREHFQRDADSALKSIGYVAPEGKASAGGCLQLQAGATLASPEEIEAARTKLEDSLVAIHGFLAPMELQSR